jgi:DNA-binding CsgD family transcriptional regulator/PAS domain-containing protein
MRRQSLRADPQALLQLVSRAVEAPMRPDGWQRFLDATAQRLSSNMGVFMLLDPDDPDASQIVTNGPGREFDREFRLRYGGEDDYFLHGMTGAPTGAIRLGSEIISPEEMRRSSVYRELAEPWGIEHFMGSVIVNDPQLNAHFSLTRPASGEPFTRHDKQLVATWLLPILRRSIALDRELRRLRTLGGALTVALDQAPYGALFLDRRGRLLHANRRGEHWLRRRDGLRLVNDRLQAPDPQLQTQLDRALVLASQRQPAPQALPLPGRGGQPAARLVIFPLPPEDASNGLPGGAACMLLIHEPAGTPSQLSEWLVQQYQLSAGEARLAAALFVGQSLAAAAETLGISRNTAKSHLARVFDKTGARSQAALLKLLALGPARG